MRIATFAPALSGLSKRNPSARLPRRSNYRSLGESRFTGAEGRLRAGALAGAAARTILCFSAAGKRRGGGGQKARCRALMMSRISGRASE